jgi:hypothetical protein
VVDRLSAATVCQQVENVTVYRSVVVKALRTLLERDGSIRFVGLTKFSLPTLRETHLLFRTSAVVDPAKRKRSEAAPSDILKGVGFWPAKRGEFGE